jgi:hypothetical protein
VDERPVTRTLRPATAVTMHQRKQSFRDSPVAWSCK